MRALPFSRAVLPAQLDLHMRPAPSVLRRYRLRVVLLEGSDDVTQGATKGNSGIVHAGYDDKPGTLRAKLCWKGNQVRCSGWW